MHNISHDARSETVVGYPNPQHLQPTYWLTCHQTQGRIVLGLRRVNSQDPAGIEFAIPIQSSYFCASIHIPNDGPLKWISRTDDVIDP